MKITVNRFQFTDRSTISSVDVDGVFECYGLEPVTRVDEVKPRAIPVGTYGLALLPSKRFNTYTPHVLNVPGFTAIEIHPGNDASDTEGCLVVGKTRSDDWVGNSDEAFRDLVAQMDAAQEMEIEYVEQRAVSA